MGNELVQFDSKQYPLLDPTQKGAQEAILANLGDQGPGEFDLERVRVPAGGGTSWTLVGLDGKEREAKELDCVLLMWKNSRAYWKESFDASGGGVPPSCTSHDAQFGVGDNGEGEGRRACADCGQSKFGSAEKGKGQACKQMKVLFCLMQGNMLPHALFLPPTSIKEMNTYMLRLASQGLKFCSVVTRLTLEKTKNDGGITYSKVKPSMIMKLTPDAAAAAWEMATKLKPAMEQVEIEQSDLQPA